MRISLMLGALLLLATPVHAMGGFDLTWDACVGSPAANQNDVAPCSDPDATQSLYVVFYPEFEMTNFIGLEFDMRIIQENSDPELAPFWFYGDQGCDPGLSLTLSAPSSLCPGTTSPWIVPESVLDFDLLTLDGQERGRLRGAIVRSAATPLTVQAGQKYFGFRLGFSMEPAALLEGCPTPMVVGIRAIRLYSATGEEQMLTAAVNGGYCANLNGAAGLACGIVDFPPPGPGEIPSDRSCGATPARNVTWGGIKALYR